MIPSSGILLIDKPAGITSHGVVSLFRRSIAKVTEHGQLSGKVRAGHAGTLDPNATGLMLIAYGEGTKLLRLFDNSDKEYEATIQFGMTSDSLDAWGSNWQHAPVPALDEETLNQRLQSYLGSHLQRVPELSALKVGGKRLYQRFFAGERDFPVPSRKVTVHAVRLLSWSTPCLSIRLHCGSGFYVRSFARDLAESLGTLGHLASLRRTKVGSYSLDRSVPLETIQHLMNPLDPVADDLHTKVMSVEDVARVCVPILQLTAAEERKAFHGQPVSFSLPTGPKPGLVALFGPAENLVALAEPREDHLKIVRGFHANGKS